MSTPTINDLDVYYRHSDQHLDYYDVHSWLTRGRCATFTISRNDPSRTNVQPFLIAKYMQGITASLVQEAVKTFIATNLKSAEVTH
jgi:hypothetical protein